MIRVATVNVDISPGKPHDEILMQMGLYVEGLCKNDKKYFISCDQAVSKTYITDEEAKRFLRRMVT